MEVGPHRLDAWCDASDNRATGSVDEWSSVSQGKRGEER